MSSFLPSTVVFLVTLSSLVKNVTGFTSADMPTLNENTILLLLLLLGILLIIFMCCCCYSCIDPLISPIYYEPKDGIYIAEYMEPHNGIIQRSVYLKFHGNDEDGWEITGDPNLDPTKLFHQHNNNNNNTKNPNMIQQFFHVTSGITKNRGGMDPDVDDEEEEYQLKNRALHITGGFMDTSGKTWFREEGYCTEVESYGRYDFTTSTFHGSWLATYDNGNKDNINNNNNNNDTNMTSTSSSILSYIAEKFTRKNIRRVKYTKFYHSEIYSDGNPPPESQYPKYEIRKIVKKIMKDQHYKPTAQDSPSRSLNTNTNTNTTTNTTDYPLERVNTNQSTGSRFDLVSVISNLAQKRKVENHQNIYQPSPDGNYYEFYKESDHENGSVTPMGNEDATLNDEYDMQMKRTMLLNQQQQHQASNRNNHGEKGGTTTAATESKTTNSLFPGICGDNCNV